MLFPAFPVSLVVRTIFPFHLAETVLFIFTVGSLVDIPLRPDKLTLSVHLVIVPSTSILTIVCIFHPPLSLFKVVFVLSYVFVSIGPLEFTLPILFISGELAIKSRTIRPPLLTLPLTLVIFPMAFVRGTIRGCVFSISMSFIIFPFSHINVAVIVEQATLPLSLLVHKLP